LADAGLERVQVKWPNDIVVDFRKLAGILVETSGEMQGPSVAVIGVGVNYRLPERIVEKIDQPVIDVVHVAARPPSRSRLLGAILARLATTLDAFEQHGFGASRGCGRALHAYRGRRGRVTRAREPAFDAEVVDVAAD